MSVILDIFSLLDGYMYHFSVVSERVIVTGMDLSGLL